MQLSYSQFQGAGYEGGRADSDTLKARAGINKNGAVVPFGRVVVVGTVPANTSLNAAIPFKLPSAAGDKVLGAVLHDMAHESNATGVPVDGMASIISQGAIYLKTEQAVVPGDPVFVRHTANGAGTAAGQVRKDLDVDKAIAIPNASFRGKAAAGEIVAVEFNLP